MEAIHSEIEKEALMGNGVEGFTEVNVNTVNVKIVDTFRLDLEILQTRFDKLRVDKQDFFGKKPC